MAPPDPRGHKAHVRRLFEGLEDRDGGAVRDLLAADFVFEPLGLDRDAYVAAELEWYEAFPDLSYSLDELIAEGDAVAFRWTFAGTHDGRGGPGVFGSVEPTGESVEVEGINIAHFEDGRIASMRAEWGVFELLHGLGLVDLPGE